VLPFVKIEHCNTWLLFDFLPKGNKISTMHLCKRENVTRVFSIHNDFLITSVKVERILPKKTESSKFGH